MNQFDLTEKQDTLLRFSIMFPGKRHSLYGYLCELPLEDLQAYPKKGYHWWMGCAARTAKGLAMRDYILHWRLFALSFRQQYSRAYLETLSADAQRVFLRTHLSKTPIWAYEEPIRDVIELLFVQSQDGFVSLNWDEVMKV